MKDQFAIEISLEKIKEFCIKWKIKEFSFFGSVTRDDFNPKESDIDILIEFEPDQHWGWGVVTMRDELQEMFHRNVDLLTKEAILKSKNPYRKNEILGSCRVVYEKAA